MSIHISGSIAFDRIMTFPGHFEDHLLPEKLHMINVCFLIDRIEEKRGGTGANIAYSLCLLGEKPSLYATVGHDYKASFRGALEDLGINLDSVHISEESLTACAYITSDKRGNQITGFSPAASMKPLDSGAYPKCKTGDWGIISPGNVDDMLLFSKHFKEKKIPYIYDPGQQIPAISKENHLTSIEGAEIFIGNDYEVELITQLTEHSKADLLEKAKYVITTLGENGCQIASGHDVVNVPAPKVDKVADPTGAGDSFRAGLLLGLSRGLDMESSVKLGSIAAAFCIEQYGTQEHTFTADTFKKRYEENYGAFPKIW